MILASGETATCMYNSPHEEESLPRVLPGKLLSLDAQCRKDRGTRYFRLENISLMLTSQTLAAPASRMTESAPSSSASTRARATACPTDPPRRDRAAGTITYVAQPRPIKYFFIRVRYFFTQIMFCQMCLNGKCVSDHENAIDYGDGGFLRRTGSVEVETFVKKSGYQDTSSSTRLESRRARARSRGRTRVVPPPV